MRGNRENMGWVWKEIKWVIAERKKEREIKRRRDVGKEERETLRKERVEKWARWGKYTIVDNEIWEVI